MFCLDIDYLKYTTYCCWKCAASCKETDEKKKTNSLIKWGTEVPCNSPIYQQQLYKEKGITSYNQLPIRIQHRKDTMLDRHNTLNTYKIGTKEEIETKYQNVRNTANSVETSENVLIVLKTIKHITHHVLKKNLIYYLKLNMVILKDKNDYRRDVICGILHYQMVQK